uniref:Uncharacterized protein n=1 Tax=Arundo donax TaxID=35708 RepID=A0A0A8YGQ6_ARUDO
MAAPMQRNPKRKQYFRSPRVSFTNCLTWVETKGNFHPSMFRQCDEASPFQVSTFLYV